MAEGPKLVGELLGHLSCKRIIATQSWSDTCSGVAAAPAVPVDIVTDDELRQISLLQTPQQVLALFRIPEWENTLADSAATQLTLALDGVQDPGNLGTIVRLADWFGIQDIWCSHGTADVWNPKAVQATMGGLARVRVHYIDLVAQLQALPVSIPVYATSLQGENIWQSTLCGNGVVVMGNEGNGVSDAVASLCRQQLIIPSYPVGSPTTESLNVAVATGIVMAEFRRQQMIS